MPDGDPTNTAATSSTQGSGQTQEGAAGAAPAAASTSTAPVSTEQGQQQGTGLLQLTQEQFEAMMRTRVAQAVRADRRKRTPAAPADGKSTAAAPTETPDADSDPDDLRTQLEQIQARLAQTDAELAKERRAVLVSKAISKHKLAAELSDRIHGQTEAEIDADAAKLAKLIGPPQAPRTEAGSGTRPASPSPQTPAGANGAASTHPNYPFQNPGDVAWT